MVEHLLEFCVLIRRKHGFKAVIARGHERFHLLSFLLREKIVILVDGLNLAAQAFLAGLDFSYLVIAEAEAQLEPFEAGDGHDLDVFVHPFAAGGDLIFLLRGQEGLELAFLFLLQGYQPGLILL